MKRLFLTSDATNLMNRAMTAMANPIVLHHLANFMASRGYRMSKEIVRYVGCSAPTDSGVLISAQMVIETIDDCVRLSGDRDFMLTFAQWLDLRAFGPVTLFWEQCPSLIYGETLSKRFVQTVNAALSYRCEMFEEEAHLFHDVLPSCRDRSDQFLMGESVFAVRLLRMKMGQSWSPLRVEIGFPYPGNPKLLQTFYRCPITFNADHFVIIVSKADMERQLGGSNQALLSFLENYLEQRIEALPSRFEFQIEHVIADNLEDGRATLDNVARLLGMSSRTLQRRLAASGTSFTSVLNLVRRRVALAYLEENPERRITDLGYRLGYSDISTVSRFLTSSFESNGQELRRRLKEKAGTERLVP